MIETRPADRTNFEARPWKLPVGRRSNPICDPPTLYARLVGIAAGTTPEPRAREIRPPLCWLCCRRTGLPFAVLPPPSWRVPIPFPDSGEVSASICRRCARSPSIRYYLKSPAIPAPMIPETHP